MRSFLTKIFAVVYSAVLQLDVEFYAAHYSDLATLKHPLRLAHHYLTTGRAEGRFPSARAADRWLKAAGLPRDFSTAMYLRLNPDVARRSNNQLEAALHFIRYGRSEGRKYHVFDPELYRDLYHPGEGLDESLRRSERGGSPGRPTNWADLLAPYGLVPGRWITLFDPFEATVSAGRRANPRASRAAAILEFLQRDLDRLKPVALGLEFDPIFVRETYPQYAAPDDVALYRTWLTVGLDEGAAGSAQMWLDAQALPLCGFPEAFDFKAQAGRDGLAQIDRWSILAALLEGGMPPTGVALTQAQYEDFVLALGQAWLRRGKPSSTVALLDTHRLEGEEAVSLKITALADDEQWPRLLAVWKETPTLGQAFGVRFAQAALAVGDLDLALTALEQQSAHSESWLSLVEAARRFAEQRSEPPGVETRLRRLLHPPASPRPKGRRRVLIANTFFAPQSIGGATIVAARQVEVLAKDRDDEVEISVACSDPAVPPGEVRCDEQFGVPVFRLGVQPGADADARLFDDEAGATFDRVVRTIDPDLVHFHSIQRLSGSAVEAIGARPYIVSLHDGWWIAEDQFFAEGNGGASPRRIGLEASRLGALLRGAHKRAAVSSWLAEQYQDAGFTGIDVIEPGVPDPQPRRPPLAGPVRIGFVGGRSRLKGYALIRASVAALTDDRLHLTLVDPLSPEGLTRRERWGVHCVTVLPAQSARETARLLASFDVLLAPSLAFESYGLAVREALSAGAWVVVSDRGAPQAAIQPGVNGFVVDPTDPEALTSLLRSLAQHPQRYRTPPPWRPDTPAAELQARAFQSIYLSLSVP